MAVQSSNITFSREGLKYSKKKIPYFTIKIQKSVSLVLGLRGLVPWIQVK
jgi:hypothetical protein